MKNVLKNGIFRVKNTLVKLTIASILVVNGLNIILPKTSEADFLLDNYTYLSDLSIAQDNTILSKSSSIETSQINKRIKMTITAYSSTPEQTDSTPFVTASGSMVRDGIVANNLLSFGTKVKIPELYGDKVFVVEDRMHSKKGNYHLDVWFLNTKEAKEFGSETTYVEILKN